MSNSSLNTFRKKTQSNFTVRLDLPFQINKENWVVPLKEIILSCDVKQITDEKYFFILRFLDSDLADKADSIANRASNDDGLCSWRNRGRMYSKQYYLQAFQIIHFKCIGFHISPGQ